MATLKEKIVTARISVQEHEQLSGIAKANDRTISYVVGKAISQHLESLKNEKPTNS